MDKYLFSVIVTHFHNFDNQKKHVSKIIIGAPMCFLIDIYFFLAKTCIALSFHEADAARGRVFLKCGN